MKPVCEITIPHESVNDEYATITKIYLGNGDMVEKGGLILDYETSKAIIEVTAEEAGYVELLCEENEEVDIGEVIVKIWEKPESVKMKDGEANAEPDAAGKTVFSKKALSLMEKRGIGKEAFSSKDFVSLDDVKNHLEGNLTATLSDKITAQKLTPGKKLEIKHLEAVQSSGLKSTAHLIVDTEEAISAVKYSVEIFDGAILPIVLFEASRLLIKYKALNAFYRGEHIYYYDNINIGVALDMDQGLKVAILPETDKLGLGEIEEGLLGLMERYEDNTLTREDMAGGTFTITDLSFENVSFFTPLINKDQSAILGISGFDPTLGGSILSLTFDHRITEGKTACRFLGELKERIESYGPPGEKTRASGSAPIRCESCRKGLEEDLKLDGIGFIKAVDHSGREILLCQTCLARV